MTKLLLLFLLLVDRNCYGSSNEICNDNTNLAEFSKCSFTSYEHAHSRNLSLPLMLTINVNIWFPNLLLYNTAGELCGNVTGTFYGNTIYLVNRESAGVDNKLICTTCSTWVNIMMVVEGYEAKLYFFGANDNVLDITCQSHKPSHLIIYPYTSHYIYSSLSPIANITANITTTVTTTITTIHQLPNNFKITIMFCLIATILMIMINLALCVYVKKLENLSSFNNLPLYFQFQNEGG